MKLHHDKDTNRLQSNSKLLWLTVASGLVMLYAVEAVRLQVEWPSSTVQAFDEQDLSREIALSEVLPYYNAWWAKNKGKSAAELMEADLLEGSGLTWHIYTTGE